MKKVIYLLFVLPLLFLGCEAVINITPVANFTVTGDNKPAPCEVNFSNSSINAAAYSWEFGDGATSTEQNTKHTYTTGGTYTVKLTATSKDGSNSTTKSIVIQNAILDPVANFTFIENGNFAPSKVTFTNSTINASTYSWDFGDGQTSTLANPSHVFLSGGTYNVTLTSKNSIEKTNIINKTITVKNTPTKLKINSIILTEVPFINPATGASWDSGNGPDLFFKLLDSSGVSNFETGRYNDVIQSNLPLTFTTGLPYTISLLDYQFIIALYDYNDFSANSLIDANYLKVRTLMPINGDAFPTTINFNEGLIAYAKFKLNVEWLE